MLAQDDGVRDRALRPGCGQIRHQRHRLRVGHRALAEEVVHVGAARVHARILPEAGFGGRAPNEQALVSNAASSSGVELDSLVGDMVQALHGCASEADERYTRSLARLRADPADAARRIEAAYRSVPGENIGARESLLLAAGRLAHPAILPLLSEAAREPAGGNVRHDNGRAAAESMLRMVAVDGIEAIALGGDTDAAEALLELAASPDRGVQASAVVALKYAEAHQSRYERVRAVLAPERLYLLDVVRIDVRDALRRPTAASTDRARRPRAGPPRRRRAPARRA